MSEKTITEEQVREEHLKEVNQPLHWVFLGAVVFGSLLFMILLIAVLGSGAA
jgi:hypothetical protein